jgi:hypothetical protein
LDSNEPSPSLKGTRAHRGGPERTERTGEDRRGASGPEGRLRAALTYARRGVPVFPLHSVDERGRCSCGKPSGCKPGKHPIGKLVPNGHKNATTDPRRIQLWWKRWPEANIGIPTGEASGLLVLDMDPDKWGAGTLDALTEEHGEPPATTTVRSGGGGLHYYFRYPAGETIRNSAGEAGKLGMGLDVRGEGGYVVAPPSRTTGAYETLEKVPLADPPEWLLVLLREEQGSRSSSENSPGPVPLDTGPIRYGSRNYGLTRVAGRLHDGTRTLEQLAAALERINRARCSPPIGEHEDDTDPDEVFKIACSIHGRKPCKVSREPEPEVHEVLETAGRYWYAELLHRGGKSKRRDVYRAAIMLAGKHGELCQTSPGDRRAAVAVEASYREIAEIAKTSAMSVKRNLWRLVDAGAMAIDRTGKSREERTRVLILEPAQKCYSHPFSISSRDSSTEPPGTDDCNTSAQPPRPDRLSTPIYRYFGHVGNAGGGVQAALEAFGPQSREELAERLGLSRAGDLERRQLRKLEGLGLIEERGATWALCADHRERAQELRRLPFVTVFRRRRSRWDGKRKVVWVEETYNSASEVERDERQREKHAADREEFRRRRLAPRRGKQAKAEEPIAPLMGPERVEELVEARNREGLAARVERQRQKVGTTAEIFVFDKLKVLGRIRLGLLMEVYADAGGDPWDIPPAIARLGCPIERLPQYENRQFVFPRPEEGAA